MAAIDLKHINRFLALSRDKRINKLETQTPGHLARLTKLLQDMPSTPVIQETLNDIAEVVGTAKETEVKKLGESANWANATILVDGKLAVSVDAACSGLYPGRRATKYGRATDGSRKRDEVEMSCADSEATGLNLLDKKLKTSEIAAATTSVEIVIVSTNGACDGCKGRINSFVADRIKPNVPSGVTVRMTYKYKKPPRQRDRNGVNTYYGWNGDVQAGSLYVHTIDY